MSHLFRNYLNKVLFEKTFAESKRRVYICIKQKRNEMKRILVNDQAVDLFFNDEVTLDRLCEWINGKMCSFDSTFDYQFDLSEAHSCTSYVSNGCVYINGDEDYKEVQFQYINPEF